jgi:hypothetical protein
VLLLAASAAEPVRAAPVQVLVELRLILLLLAPSFCGLRHSA